MSESGLVTYRRYTQNCNKRTQPITKITIHHMAAHWTAKQCVDSFMNPQRQASSNYCIGYNGEIGQSVSESNRAWTSGSSWNDQRAITIEVANSSVGGNWPISDASYKSLVALCADICKRNNIKEVNYIGTKDGILTCHFMFQSTACCGPYLRNLHTNGQLVNDINKAIKDGTIPAPVPSPTPAPAPTPIPAPVPTPNQKFIVDGIDCNYVFDPVYYYNKYPDLQKAIGNNPDQLFNHFLHFGMKESRQAKADFDVTVYKNSNPDLQAAFGENMPKYYQHYCIAGHNENRKHC